MLELYLPLTGYRFVEGSDVVEQETYLGKGFKLFMNKAISEPMRTKEPVRIKAESAPAERDYLRIGIAATVAFAVVLAVMTLSSVPVKSAPGADKVYHVLAFAVLAFPLPFVRPKLTAMVVVAVITYGGAIEIIQPFFGRQAELMDLLADAVGAFIGATSGLLASRSMLRRM